MYCEAFGINVTGMEKGYCAQFKGRIKPGQSFCLHCTNVRDDRKPITDRKWQKMSKGAAKYDEDV